MAKAEYQRELTVILTLSEAEAVWIKNMVQNPVGTNPEDENEVSSTIRHSLWSTLSELQDFGYSDD